MEISQQHKHYSFFIQTKPQGHMFSVDWSDMAAVLEYNPLATVASGCNPRCTCAPGPRVGSSQQSNRTSEWLQLLISDYTH